MSNLRLIIIFVIISPFLFGSISLAPWVPTKRIDINRIINIMNLTGGEVIYEIGSGDGRVTFLLGKVRQDIKVVGIEINVYLYLFTQIKKQINKVQNVEFVNRNLFKCDISNADIVYLYGLPDNNAKIVNKLKKDLKSGTRIISYVFELPGLRLIDTNKPTPQDLSIYVYEV